MVWDKTKEILQEELSDNVFSLWIEPLACVQVQEDRIRLACPDRFFSAYIAQNYLNIIQEKVNETDPLQRKVVLCETNSQPMPISNQRRTAAAPQCSGGRVVCAVAASSLYL